MAMGPQCRPDLNVTFGWDQPTMIQVLCSTDKNRLVITCLFIFFSARRIDPPILNHRVYHYPRSVDASNLLVRRRHLYGRGRVVCAQGVASGTASP